MLQGLGLCWTWNKDTDVGWFATSQWVGVSARLVFALLPAQGLVLKLRQSLDILCRLQ